MGFSNEAIYIHLIFVFLFTRIRSISPE